MPGNETHKRIENLIAGYVLKYNYWGYLFSQIKRKPVKIPYAMGVFSEPDGTFCLGYNDKMMDNTDNENILYALIHEGMHLLNKHLPRLIRILSDEPDKFKKHYKMKLWNWAADACVNFQAKIPNVLTIDGKPYPLFHPKDLKDKDGNPFPENKTAEWYYNELLKFNKKDMEKFSSMMKKFEESLKNHNKWMEGANTVTDPNSLSRKMDSFITDLIRNSYKSFSRDNSRGTLPAHLRDLIEKALGPPVVPYYEIIKKLVKGSRLSKFKRSHTKVNRKRGYVFCLDETDNSLPKISPFPGRTRDFTFNVGNVIDTSGSMDIEWIREGLSGVKNILEKDRHCYVTVMQVDTIIESEYRPKKISDIKFEAKGRGGTILLPGLERAKELGVDVCLVFTDGYCENFNTISRKLLPKKIIWIITPNGKPDNVNKTGYVIRI